VEILFEGDVFVQYGFVHLDSGVGGLQTAEPRAGQRNGLLGAAEPGLLVVSTGMHTGFVPFRVEAHPAAPPVDTSYDEIVEASCDLRGPAVSLSTFDWATSFVVTQGGPHRVRLSARDFEAGREQDRYELHEPVRDSYLIQLWPAAPAPDEVIRVSSAEAAYWHGVALEHPTPSPSPHEQALAEQRYRDTDEGRQEADRDRNLRRLGTATSRPQED